MTTIRWTGNMLLAVLLLGAPLQGQTREQIRDVQQALTDRGFQPGPVDGLMGGKTRRAIRDYQESIQVTPTGRLDNATLRGLKLDQEIPTSVSIPSGTRIQVILDDALSSKNASQGDGFAMTTVRDVFVGGVVAIPARTRVWGEVREVERAQRPQKGGKLVLGARTLALQDESVRISGTVTTGNDKDMKGRGSAKSDLKKIGIGAGVGAVVGGLIGGGKGVAAGLAIGGGGTFLATKGEQVNLEPETALVVELSRSVTVPLQ